MFNLLVYSFLSFALFKTWDSNLLLNLQESLLDSCDLLENVSERIADVPFLKTYIIWTSDSPSLSFLQTATNELLNKCSVCYHPISIPRYHFSLTLWLSFVWCVCIYIRSYNIYHSNHIQIPELDSCKTLFYVEPKSLIWMICRCDLRAASKCRGRNVYCDQNPPTHAGVGPLFAVSESASAPAPKHWDN